MLEAAIRLYGRFGGTNSNLQPPCCVWRKKNHYGSAVPPVETLKSPSLIRTLVGGGTRNHTHIPYLKEISTIIFQNNANATTASAYGQNEAPGSFSSVGPASSKLDEPLAGIAGWHARMSRDDIAIPELLKYEVEIPHASARHWTGYRVIPVSETNRVYHL